MLFAKPDLNSIVAKSNELVPKLSKFDLQELRLIAYALAHLDSTKAENKTFTARVEDMAHIYGMAEDRAYSVVQKVVASMNTKPLKVIEGDEDIYIYWFSKFSYKSGTGTFTFTLTEHIRPYLLELKQRFTFYRLGDVHEFKAASTWKLYEHLNQWKYTGAWHVSLDFLRNDVFGVAGKYDRFDLLRQRLIDPAVEEINNKSNLNVSYVKEREGKSVAFLRFFIQTGEKLYIKKEEYQKNMLLKQLLDCGIRKDTAEKLLRDFAELGKEEYFLEKVQEIMRRWTEAKGPMARYVVGALKKVLYEVKCDSRPYAEAYKCWVRKKELQTKCKVRIRGKAGNRHKCKMCMLHIPPDQFGV